MHSFNKTYVKINEAKKTELYKQIKKYLDIFKIIYGASTLQ